jgi:hypothetical protein
MLGLIYMSYHVLVQMSGDRDYSIDWVQLSRVYLKPETESSLRNAVYFK